MKSEFEWNRMIGQQLYSPYKVGGDSWTRVHVAQKAFNESEFWHDRSALEDPQKSAVAFGDQSRRDVPAPRDIY